MGPQQINLNPTTFLRHNEDRKFEKVWTLPRLTDIDLGIMIGAQPVGN